MGIDPFLDMRRAAMNIMSDAMGSAQVGRWKGEHYGDGCRGTPKEKSDNLFTDKISLKS